MKPQPSYRVVTDRLFREQWSRKKALRARIDEIWEKDWKTLPSGKGGSQAKFATDYEEALRAAGAFQFTESGDLNRTRLNATHTFKLRSYLLLPVTIGQRRDGESAFYTEEMAMLTRAGADISKRRVIAHQAPLCLLYSRHFLERLFDRGNVSADITTQLNEDAVEIARKLAFALSVGLAKTEFSENGGQAAFVPYRAGLIIFASKVLAGRTSDENFGWKFDFTRQKYSRPYLKADLIKDAAKSAEARADNKMLVQSWYAATYVSDAMLSQAQRKFVSDFEAVYSGVKASEIDQAFQLLFDPDFKKRPDKCSFIELTDELQSAFDHVERSLENDSLRVHGKYPVMFIVDDQATSDAINGKVATNT
jgi:hypothetical protein